MFNSQPLQSLRQKRMQLPEQQRKDYMVRCLTHAIVSILPLPAAPVGDYLQHFLTSEQRRVMRLLETMNEWEIIPIDEVLEAVRVYMNYRYQFAYPNPTTMLLLETAVILEKKAVEEGKSLQTIDPDVFVLAAQLKEQYETLEDTQQGPYNQLSDDVVEKTYE